MLQSVIQHDHVQVLKFFVERFQLPFGENVFMLLNRMNVLESKIFRYLKEHFEIESTDLKPLVNAYIQNSFGYWSPTVFQLFGDKLSLSKDVYENAIKKELGCAVSLGHHRPLISICRIFHLSRKEFLHFLDESIFIAQFNRDKRTLKIVVQTLQLIDQ